MPPEKQLGFEFPRRGGKRRGAGRKPTGARAGVSHGPRARVTRHVPLHVTLRVRRDISNLRQRFCWEALREAFRGGCARAGFRLVHFSVQSNHMHLLVEADDNRALSRGMQGLCIRVARDLNAVMMRRGPVFADRFHAHVLRSPREVRHALLYVLNNARRHAAASGERLPRGWVDPCSSSAVFDGWREVRAPHDSPPVPVVAARCWLLTIGWRKRGLLSIDEVPASRAAATASAPGSP